MTPEIEFKVRDRYREYIIPSLIGNANSRVRGKLHIQGDLKMTAPRGGSVALSENGRP